MKKCLSPLSIVELFVPLPNRSSIMGTMYKASFDSLQNPDQNDAHDVNKNAAEYASHLEITPINFMKLCPALIAQIEEGSCSERPAPESSHHEVTSFGKIASIYLTWISAINNSFCSIPISLDSSNHSDNDYIVVWTGGNSDGAIN